MRAVRSCSRIYNNITAHLLSAVDKEVVRFENTIFKDNHYYQGGYSNSVIKDIFLWQRPPEKTPTVEANAIHKKNDLRVEYYKRLEYLSRKLNDPDKINKPKGRQLFLPYWQKAVREYENFIKTYGSNWETESMLGKFYQLGLQMDIKDAWTKAESHLKRAMTLNPFLPRDNNLALGVLYASKHFSFSTGIKDNRPKLTVRYKPQTASYLTAAERELLKDNGFPGTSNFYLFLICYFQGKFEMAVKQADRYLEVFPDDEFMMKLRSMARKRIGNLKPPGELNVYIDLQKTRRLFDYYFIQGNTSGKNAVVQSSEFIAPDIKKYFEELTKKLEKQNQPNLEEFIYHGLPDIPGNTQQEIISHLGSPMAISTRQVDSPYRERVKNTVSELVFEGLFISFYDTGDEEFILQRKITSPVYKTKFGLDVGESIDRVKETLGEPDESWDDELKYTCEDINGLTILVFRFEENRITAIEWYFPEY